MNNRLKGCLLVINMLMAMATVAYAQQINPMEGRWDMVISQDGKELPSWLEIRHSGTRTLVGRFVYAMGSARPISEVKVKDGRFSFAIPPQWEDGNSYMEFEGIMAGDDLKGTMLYTNGKTYNWVATRAPKLAYTKNPKWGKPIKLFNGKDLSGWQAMGENQWIVDSGVLKSPKSGSNLVSDQKFDDFKLHLEFKYPKGSNSGVYLRGRYEVQITDSKGAEPSDVEYSGVYGFLTPSEVVAKAAGEWQEYDITLIGRRITVVANGITVISDQIIPGITGGALDSMEGEPGPLYFQGDHGPIEFRNITVTPRVD
ncbi:MULTISPECIES: DUF1080 domain-containing protein [unclassified Arenibacter]|uniref:3-keto-disaccharide hydrolase n=1 Tax=unclassified Arenibacter TaxID=2615047 RepID=UPI000E349359|nr:MULTISPECIES: DUF1080 domain-containing protein [unclassified Arenibacter]MCM4163897.1 DUF1080 domain-containing protein [Arenibacter sp. A80]RFT56604.1 DUF1080 domain-containing protein [Arenibacter sp. P308M17]